MIYISSFKLSQKKVNNPNIYPYSVFKGKDPDPFVFSPITVLYGENGSGKSTILNIMANRLHLRGKEFATSNKFGITDYCNQYISECNYSLAEDELGIKIHKLPEKSRYIKSEDILYEIKKIQQEEALAKGMTYDVMQTGKSKEAAERFSHSKEGREQIEYIKFAQEKYSNGETSMQYFDDVIVPDALYLLDEPEVSLSPQKQVELAQSINKYARFLSCQFVIATHSPFMLGTLNAKIYNIDTECYEIQEWTELPNVRYFFQFFEENRLRFT